jgi:phosphate transport system substrate-binding protein
VPVALGAEGVAYNLDLPAGTRLRLTGPVLARIFLGQITRWHDPAITALNPGTSLPDAPITVVHRSDGSGTTYIFSNYLSSVPPPGQPRSAPERPSTGRSGKAPKATAV